MNILPKKRWHVRTKENIARVRRDEAQAAEEARIEQARIDKAESEARLHFLRNESRKKNGTATSDSIASEPEPDKSTKSSSKHINFFEELEQGNIDHTKTNKEYEKDKKEEQEKYEKQIGLLTYLGQGLQEAVNKSWYNELPKRVNDPEKNIEIKPNKKILDDPIQDVKRYLNIISIKNKIKPKVKSESSIIETSKNNLDVKESKKSGEKRKRKLSEDDSTDDERKSHKKQKCKSSDDNSSEDGHKSRKKHKKKHKKHKKSKKQKHEKETTTPSTNIEQLRAERLEREKRERLRAQALLAAKGKSVKGSSQVPFRQKYNSQFFPQLARQNCEKDYR
ncbi:hypothetical protein TSAR_015982 [Trichomalopsis sarcophagae]|uniref:CBF1-interacting co-repressor CIR N-terminal domain-containing protein n=1 Tax=Trichomalopsis sarcophagae TaxID=543379 RepID=A0A232FKN8_9HYME|nr:hypothetical protein TSAR_015982 [Trichomalopsis sarcophagae]